MRLKRMKGREGQTHTERERERARGEGGDERRRCESIEIGQLEN